MYLQKSEVQQIEIIATNEMGRTLKGIILEYGSRIIEGWVQGIDPSHHPHVINVVSSDGGPDHEIDFEKLRKVTFKFHGNKPDVIIGNN